MHHRKIAGLNIAYELLGKPGAPAIALTPGGRFAMDSPGVRELGEALAAGGAQVLLWDRPNCGSSDMCFEGENESEVQAHVLTELIRALDLGPTTLAAGSGGSRVAMMAASRDPEIVSHLVMWWISGGRLGLIFLAYYYCVDYATRASLGGMAAVAKAPGLAEQIGRNPRNLEIILAQDPEKFIATMARWADFYLTGTTPVPGMTLEDFAALRMKVLIYRSGISDLSHTRQTSEEVHGLIPNSRLIEPPWADDEWNRQLIATGKEGKNLLFANWPALAPGILAFTGD